MIKKILSLGLFVCTAFALQAQVPNPGPPVVAPDNFYSDSVMVTVILKHQQDKNLTEIRRKLEAQGFWDMFPPQEARIVSWTLTMGLGHVIVLQIPAGAVRKLNLAIEHGAWGAYDSEIYLTYDYVSIWKDYVRRRLESKSDRED